MNLPFLVMISECPGDPDLSAAASFSKKVTSDPYSFEGAFLEGSMRPSSA
jgi:hypothetical protein